MRQIHGSMTQIQGSTTKVLPIAVTRTPTAMRKRLFGSVRGS